MKFYFIFSNKSKQRIKQRKPLSGEIPTTSSIELTPEELKKNKFLLEEMTGLADQFVSNGQLDIYQETYEQLKTKLDHLQLSTSNSTTNPIFDMYGESDITSSVTNSTSSTNKNRKYIFFLDLIYFVFRNIDSSTVLWEYTIDDDDNNNIQGSFTTEQMILLTTSEEKLNKDKIRCRRIGTEQFYSIKHIDFDLFLD
jgi:hypothetical protein